MRRGARRRRTRVLLLLRQKIFDKADAIVLEHGFAAVLRGVKVDIAHDAEVVVAVLVCKDLVNVPHVVGLLVRFIEREHRGRAGVRVGKDFLVTFVIGIEDLFPAGFGHTPVGIEFAQLACVIARGKRHAAHERVAHE